MQNFKILSYNFLPREKIKIYFLLQLQIGRYIIVLGQPRSILIGAEKNIKEQLKNIGLDSNYSLKKFNG